MIKFKCPNCSHRIGAPDDYAGKKARCSKCKQPVRVPSGQQIAEVPDPDVIKFRCDKCNQKIAIAAIHVGKRVKCKKCENICVVAVAAAAAAIPAIEPAPLRLAEDAPADDMFGGGMDLAALAAGDAVEVERPKASEDDQPPPTEIRKHGILQDSKPERKLPWPIDMLLYPASVTGILTIVFVVTTDFLEDIMYYGGLLGLGINLFTYWYCCQCVHTSAEGGLRAPAPLDIKGGFDIWAEFWSYVKVMFSCLSFAGPLIAYFGYSLYAGTAPNPIVLLALAAYAVFFFPMGLLAMILFDSLAALNPWLLVRSIISTFPQYICLVVAFYGLGATYYYLVLKAMFNIIPGTEEAVAGTMNNAAGVMHEMLIIKIVSEIGFMWLLFVLCHLLGRFFYKNEQKLYWEV